MPYNKMVNYKHPNSCAHKRSDESVNSQKPFLWMPFVCCIIKAYLGYICQESFSDFRIRLESSYLFTLSFVGYAIQLNFSVTRTSFLLLGLCHENRHRSVITITFTVCTVERVSRRDVWVNSAVTPAAKSTRQERTDGAVYVATVDKPSKARV